MATGRGALRKSDKPVFSSSHTHRPIVRSALSSNQTVHSAYVDESECDKNKLHEKSESRESIKKEGAIGGKGERYEEWIQEHFVYEVGDEGKLEQGRMESKYLGKSTDGYDMYVYKKVDRKVRPIATTLPEEYRIIRKVPRDPLADLPILPTKPPEFVPGPRYTEERRAALNVRGDGFLTEEEARLVDHFVRVHEDGFAWEEEEKGRFSDEYFEPVVIPTVEHIPWTEKNIPIPPGVYAEGEKYMHYRQSMPSNMKKDKRK